MQIKPSGKSSLPKKTFKRGVDNPPAFQLHFDMTTLTITKTKEYNCSASYTAKNPSDNANDWSFQWRLNILKSKESDVSLFANIGGVNTYATIRRGDAARLIWRSRLKKI